MPSSQSANTAAAPGEAALSVSGLSLAIGGAGIVNDVDLGVCPGEFLGVIGPNGAGKTTLLNVLSGLVAPTRGAVLLGGRDITAWPPERRASAGVGRTFQTSSVFPALSAFENVRLAAAAASGGNLRLWRRAAADREATRAAEDGLRGVGLETRARMPAGSLSHGDKRKLEVAVLLAMRPAVMLLDEPMAGVSAEDVPELTELIGRIRGNEEGTTGTAVVMVEHHIDVVLGLAGRVAVMHHGALLACDTPERVMADPEVQASYLGEPM